MLIIVTILQNTTVTITLYNRIHTEMLPFYARGGDVELFKQRIFYTTEKNINFFEHMTESQTVTKLYKKHLCDAVFLSCVVAQAI